MILALALAACGGAIQPGTAVSSAPTGGCGVKASQRDATGALIGSSGDSTTIRVTTPQDLRAGSEGALQFYMTGVSPLTVYAENPNGARVTPRAIDITSADEFVVRLTFPTPGCWRIHSERAGGKLAGDVWLSVSPAR